MWRLRWHLARFVAFLRPRRADAEMSREMHSHLAMLEDEYRRRGLSDEAASRAARKRFGAEERMRDLHRDVRIPLWLEQLRQDMCYTLRGLASNRSYAAMSILTLGLGIGASSALFSVVHPLMIEPLPFDRPGQLVQVVEAGTASDWGGDIPRAYPLPPLRLAELRTGLSTAEGVFQAYSFNTTLFEPGEPSSIRISGVSEGAFATLRAQARLGRLLEPADHAPGAAQSAVASYSAWQRYWSGEAGAIGARLALDLPAGRRTFTLVGVVSEDFDLPIGSPGDPSADFWIPGDFSGHGTGSGLTTIVRVRDDLDIDAAAAEIGSRLSAMNIQSYSFDAGNGELQSVPAGEARLVALNEREIEDSGVALVVLIAIVGMVLLIACMNVASLMLGRLAARDRELAIRSSLGASRMRLIRQVLTESLVLSITGAAVGVLIAWGGVQVLADWPGNATSAAAPFLRLPRVDGIALDVPVLAFAFTASVFTGLLCGLSPALSIANGQTASRARRTSAGAGRGDVRRRSALIVMQMTLAMVLLIFAGLLMKSFLRLTAVDPGFSGADVVTFEVTASREHFRPTEPFGGGVGYFEDLAEDIARLPGVDAVGYGPAPFSFGGGNAIEVKLPTSRAAMTSVLDVSEGYLDALGVPVLRGRGLNDGDDAGQPLVMLVNEQFVRQHLAGSDPIGMLVGTSMGRPPLDAEIVGVVGDIRRGGLNAEPYPQVFVDYRQASAGGNVDYWWTFFAVRTSQPEAVVNNVSAMVRRFDRDARIDRVSSLDEIVSNSIAAPRFLGLVFSAFAIAGITLAVIGLYGTISYFVTQRTGEIGVRMALGATAQSVRSMILRQSAVLASAGILIGVATSLAGAGYLGSILFGVAPTDAPTYFAIALSFLAVAMLAAWLPARRATAIDPQIALRHD
jgi:putative ABC transport system permease protein